MATILFSALVNAQAAEIILEKTAVQKLVEQGQFKDNGRFYVHKGPCTAYLEYPAVTLRDGRVSIRTHLSGRFGAEVGGTCLGFGLASWAVVSGTPNAIGNVVRLADIRIDEVEDSTTRTILESGLVPTLPNAVELDVLKAVRSMLQGTNGEVQAEVRALSIQTVGVADSKLSVRFEFTLVGK